MSDSLLAGDTVAHIFRKLPAANEAVQRLRAAGFADVRISERTGFTTAGHVPPSDGLTESDFATSLQQAGFTKDDACSVARAVSRGDVLVTVGSGERRNDAIAVLRGEVVTAPSLHPAEHVAQRADGRAAGAAADAYEGVVPTGDAPVHDGAIEEAQRVSGAPGDRVLQLRTERLEVEKNVKTSEARIRRESVIEQRTITVPVRREQLVIERDGAEPIRVPLHEQANDEAK